MNPQTRFTFVAVFLSFSLLACNLPAQTPQIEPQTDPLAGTMTALAATIQAQDSQPAATNTPPGPPPLPSETATLEFTNTPSVPLVSVSLDTNCRSGPGKEFDYLGALLVGEKAEVVGKNTTYDYWVIKNPDGAGTCWLWGRYATVEGNISAIPEVAAPPTPTPSIPKAPGGFSVAKVCKTLLGPPPTPAMTNATLTWNDKSDNEDGFYIYRDGALIATLGPGVETYSEDPPGLSHTYGVAAFNSVGTSNIKQESVSCP